jgi:hypothetical protein
MTWTSVAGAGVDRWSKEGVGEVEPEEGDHDDEPYADAKELHGSPGDEAEDDDQGQADGHGYGLLSADGTAVRTGGEFGGSAGVVVGGEAAARGGAGGGVLLTAAAVVGGADLDGADTGHAAEAAV